MCSVASMPVVGMPLRNYRPWWKCLIGFFIHKIMLFVMSGFSVGCYILLIMLMPESCISCFERLWHADCYNLWSYEVYAIELCETANSSYKLICKPLNNEKIGISSDKTGKSVVLLLSRLSWLFVAATYAWLGAREGKNSWISLMGPSSIYWAQEENSHG